MRRSIIRTAPLILLFAAGTSACAASGERVSRNPDVITQEELVAANTSDLEQAVQRLRPRWLQIRAMTSMSGAPGQIVVFLNNSYQGGPEALRQFTSRDVTEIRYLDAAKAQATLQGYPTGMHVVAGIVLVTGSD